MGGAAYAQTATSGSADQPAASPPSQADQAAPVAPETNPAPQDQTGAAVNPNPAAEPGAQTAPGASTTSSTGVTTSSSAAPAAGGYAANTSFTQQTVAMAPVPDTPANRAKYGGPMSRAGKHTKPAGN
jgi:hypothetical protein